MSTHEFCKEVNTYIYTQQVIVGKAYVFLSGAKPAALAVCSGALCRLVRAPHTKNSCTPP